MSPIGAVIVESHHHALEHIHAAIRRRRRPKLNEWEMIHFDAHPDMACPGNHISALSCFVPRAHLRRKLLDPGSENDGDEEDESFEEKDLYELLDSTSSGIAEWILPLALAADLRRVQWIRPSFATQLPLGNHEFHVGAYCDTIEDPKAIKSFMDLPDTARLRVDWNHPYYLEDGCAVSTECLALCQKLALDVVELPIEREDADTEISSSTTWVLDICLDYFAVENPFQQDLIDTDINFYDALEYVMHRSRCSKEFERDSPESHEDLEMFRDIVRMIIHASVEKDIIDDDEVNRLTEELLKFYDEQAHEVDEMVRRLVDSTNASILEMALDAIPNWYLPHDTASADPDCFISSIERVREYLEQQSLHRPRPMLITIARSADDGFTPQNVVEDIQERVIDMLKTVYSINENVGSSTPNSGCALTIVKDYGEWEGSEL